MPRKLIALLVPVLTAGLVIVPPPRLRVASAVRLCASESSFDEIFAQGTAYVQSGDLDLALGNFKRCAKIDPSHAPTQQLIEKLSALEVDEDEDDAPEEPEEPEEPEPLTREQRVDAALASLGKTGSAAAAAAETGIETPSPELLPGALVVVAGGDTSLGAEAMRILGGAGFETRAVGAGASKAELSEANALVVVSEAAGGKGGVAPDALPALMEKVPDSVTRLLYVSTHGVERTGQMPFSMQNVFGQLDKLRAAEQEVQLRALNKVPSYSIVRVGKIGGGGERCEVLPGDGLQGDVSAAAAGAVVRESLLRAEAVNASLSVGPLAAGGGAATDAEHWDDMFLKLVGPEIFRKPLKALGAAAAASWIQEWAQGFFKEGQKLTTPIQVENVEDGVCIRFLEKGGTGYADFDEPETVDDRYAASRAASSAGRAKARARADGALLVVAEAAPSPRVRVARAEMREGTVVKEMSEQTVLARLEKDLAARESARG